MGHSDLKTTEKYLNPEEGLKRKAVNRLSLGKQSNAPEKNEHAREEDSEAAAKRREKS
jgi:hypothetical protein